MPDAAPEAVVTCLTRSLDQPRRQVRVSVGTPLVHAVRATGLPVGTACDLEGICAACGLEVLEGAENLSTERPLERAAKLANGVSDQLRLSCLARVRGPVTVRATYW